MGPAVQTWSLKMMRLGLRDWSDSRGTQPGTVCCSTDDGDMVDCSTRCAANIKDGADRSQQTWGAATDGTSARGPAKEEDSDHGAGDQMSAAWSAAKVEDRTGRSVVHC